ncbi:MAG: FliA/WhiG family RNA polymerase sigma factor [Myxococcota bacterium]
MTAVAHTLPAPPQPTTTATGTPAANSGPAVLRRVDVGGPAANEAPPAVDPTQYMDFVKRLASRLARNLPSHVSFDDLVGAGMLGLIDATRRYDPSKSDRFETFAEFRIKGAILDELRRYDLMARNARLASKRIARKTQELTAKLGRPPVEEELAEALELTIADYRKLVSRVGSVRMLSLDDMSRGDDDGGRGMELPSPSPRPDELSMKREMIRRLGEAISNLPPRQQRVLEMYYQREMTLREIGGELGVTESRICQIMGEATRKLRTMLRPAR